VGKGKLFWFFSVGFVCRQKPNVLDRAEGFFTMRYNNGGCYKQVRIAGKLASLIFNSCQTEKLPERINAHRKPLLPNSGS
jgi:hypothetical protein